MAKFGEFLKRERIMRDISIEEISQKIKIKTEFIEAIEADRYETLPDTAYTKGYIRAYSDYIGLNTSEVMLIFQKFFDMKSKKGQVGVTRSRKQSFYY